ncbi:hypothetical protein METH_17940 [Leisingera methylohalidivorans DSM 14336]|uniref:Uncharacterized protein n=1 Tax=Leisingera methylohalidivorans DSM 14336 TaxID=999552 RepID=V9W0V5_9RHOB|nr:hypothetical protein METH_17940 [Leisingera methylohalidivorans DSM 14336]
MIFQALLHKPGFEGFVAQIWMCPNFPIPRTVFPCGLGNRYAKSSIAIEDGNADLDVRHLAVEAPRHEALAEQFDRAV